MSNNSSLVWRLELIWWIFTAVLLAAVLYPILRKLPGFPFLVTNCIFVIIFITFTRYIFLLRHTFLAQQQRLKLLVIILCIPILFYLINNINYFQTFFDENGITAVVGTLPYDAQGSMANYIRSELLFFGVGGVIAAVILPIRLIISIWRLRNRGVV